MTRLLNTLDPDACTEEQGAIMHEYRIAFSESEDNSDMENVLAMDVLLVFSHFWTRILLLSPRFPLLQAPLSNQIVPHLSPFPSFWVMQLMYYARSDIFTIWLTESLLTLWWMEMVLFLCIVQCSCSARVFEWREGGLFAFFGVCVGDLQGRSDGSVVDAWPVVYALSELSSAIHGCATKAVGKGWIEWRVVIVDGVEGFFAMIAATTKSQ